MTGLVTIGEFSRMTHLSVKALRHYHDVGVLAPADIDAQNGYRLYDRTQLGDAHLIRRLRDLDMPLDAIQVVLIAGDSSARDEAIAAHLRRMEERLERTQSVVASLRQLLTEPSQDLAVEYRYLPVVNAFVTVEQVSRSEIEVWSSRTFEALDARARQLSALAAWPSGSLFSEGFFTEGGGEVTAFVPIGPNARHPDGVEACELSGGHFAAAIHRGSYVDLDRTYGALGAFVNELGLGADGPIREHYLQGPQDVTDRAELRTELLWPLSGVLP